MLRSLSRLFPSPAVFNIGLSWSSRRRSLSKSQASSPVECDERRNSLCLGQYLGQGQGRGRSASLAVRDQSRVSPSGSPNHLALSDRSIDRDVSLIQAYTNARLQLHRRYSFSKPAHVYLAWLHRADVLLQIGVSATLVRTLAALIAQGCAPLLSLDLYDALARRGHCPQSLLQDAICTARSHADASAWLIWTRTGRRPLSRRALMHLFTLLDPDLDGDLRAWTALECAYRNCRLTPDMIAYFRHRTGRYAFSQDALHPDGRPLSVTERRRLMWAYTHADNHRAVMYLYKMHADRGSGQDERLIDLRDVAIAIESSLRQRSSWMEFTESLLIQIAMSGLQPTFSTWHRICNHCLQPPISNAKLLIDWRRRFCKQYHQQLRFLFHRPMRFYLQRRQYGEVIDEILAMLQAGYRDLLLDRSTSPILIKAFLAVGWFSPHDLVHLHQQRVPVDRRLLWRLSDELPSDHVRIEDRHHLDIVIKSILIKTESDSDLSCKLDHALPIYEQFTTDRNPLPRTVFRLIRLCATLDRPQTANHIIKLAIQAGFNFNQRRQSVCRAIFNALDRRQ